MVTVSLRPYHKGLLTLESPAISSASQDYGAGPVGEFATAKCGSLAWEKYGLKGIRGRSFPAPGEVVADGNVSYHLRVGKHDLTLWDWNRYMDFADAHGWSRAVPAADGRIEKTA